MLHFFKTVFFDTSSTDLFFIVRSTPFHLCPGGGLFRDFMDHLTTTAFAPEKGFFSTTSDLLLYPNAACYSLADFEFLGRVLGKAVYSNMLVKPQFALTFLNKLLDRTTVIDDLYTLDPEVGR